MTEELLKPSSPLTAMLIERCQASRASLTGLRSPTAEPVFERLALIYPSSIEVENYGRRRPLAAFNPGALLRDGKLLIYPRLVFDYYWYVSSVGLFSIGIEEALEGDVPERIPTKIILYPTGTGDLRGCEDPRVQELGGTTYILYTAVAPGERGAEARQAVAVAENGSARKIGFFKLRHGERDYKTFWKDSAVIPFNLPRIILLTRPSIPLEGGGYLEVCWRGEASMSDLSVDSGSMEPILLNEPFEVKVGWSTNALKVSSNEYLVGWHGVGRDLIYRNGLALVGACGELIGVTNYLLEPRGTVEEFYGDRPGVVFGCGLVKHGEQLLWVGGVSDYAIGIWSAELDKVFEKIRYVRG
uniref:Glycosidase n=1 Tax=Thermofilum pendens TaxID=2269 RepID=A0A7C4B9D1_THEPE